MPQSKLQKLVEAALNVVKQHENNYLAGPGDSVAIKELEDAAMGYKDEDYCSACRASYFKAIDGSFKCLCGVTHVEWY